MSELGSSLLWPARRVKLVVEPNTLKLSLRPTRGFASLFPRPTQSAPVLSVDAEIADHQRGQLAEKLVALDRRPVDQVPDREVLDGPDQQPDRRAGVADG